MFPRFHYPHPSVFPYACHWAPPPTGTPFFSQLEANSPPRAIHCDPLRSTLRASRGQSRYSRLSDNDPSTVRPHRRSQLPQPIQPPDRRNEFWPCCPHHVPKAPEEDAIAIL